MILQIFSNWQFGSDLYLKIIVTIPTRKSHHSKSTRYVIVCCQTFNSFRCSFGPIPDSINILGESTAPNFKKKQAAEAQALPRTCDTNNIED
jgi:hypothetical protein